MSRNDPFTATGFSTTQTPQNQPIPGRNMIRNNAGGYCFEKSLQNKLEDFLILGTTGGTYYVGQDKLTMDNIDWLIDAIKSDGAFVVNTIVELTAGQPPRAPKPRPGIFALAMVFTFGDAKAKQAAKAAFPKIVRTTDHLSMYFGYAKQLKGKSQGTGLVTGRAMRSAIGSWFTAPSVDSVAWKACKARQRVTPAGEAFTLRDALRVSHPRPESWTRQQLLGWLADNIPDDQARESIKAIDDFLTAKSVTSPREAVVVIRERHVPWEFLPSEVLSDAQVWQALAETIGLTALIRNLARMTKNGALTPFSPTVETVVNRLSNQEALNKARIHPIDLFLALRVYKAGHAMHGNEHSNWHPVADIIDVLEKAYDLSFGAVAPSGRKSLVAVDSSGSMCADWDGSGVNVGGTDIGTPYEIACAMAVILKRIEGPNVHVIDVDTSVHPSRVTARTNLREIRDWVPSGGGTNLSLPFSYASQNNLRVDGFTVFTDNETWAGRQHPEQALDEYRRRYGPVRAVVASLTATGHSIADPNREGVLNIAGMDASLPKIITEFLR